MEDGSVLDMVRILSGEYAGLIGTVVMYDVDRVIVQLGGEEHEGETVTLHANDVEPVSDMAKLLDDPQKVSLDDE